jgi:hypothetical protein
VVLSMKEKMSEKLNREREELCVLSVGPAILTRPVNQTRTQHKISGFGFTVNGFGS